MIDVESRIYTPIAEALRAAFTGIHVSSDYTLAPSSFPHVSIVEMDNYLSLNHADSGDSERIATLMYQVDVCVDKASGRKTLARSIMKFIDDLMYKMNFTRLSLSPVPNMEDTTIYRLTGRYRADTDGTTLYRR